MPEQGTAIPVYSRDALPTRPLVSIAMLTVDRDAVAAALPYAALVHALEAAFRGDYDMPARTHHGVPVPGAADATLLMMPAWQAGKSLGVKIATVFPDNQKQGIASVNASYLLLDATTGLPRVLLDGTELTLRRTACASALASRYLSRPDAATLLMVGTGKLAPHMIAAHAAVRPIERVLVWGRNRDKAAAIVAALGLPGVDAEVASSIEAGLADADVVSCATLATQPLIAGSALRHGQHVDLVGAFNPSMREADDDALARARVYVDTRAGAFGEAGEIVQGFERGIICESDIVAELCELARDPGLGRRATDEITLFKSVGCALEDLVAATLVAANTGS